MAARDVLFGAVLLFALSLAFFVTHYMVNTVSDEMLLSTQINSSSETVQVISDGKDLTNRLDYFFVFVFIGLMLSLMITGYLIGGYKILMAIYFIIVLVSVVLSAVLANVWEVITNTSPIVSSLSSMPMTNHLMLYLPFYISVFGFIGLVVMFAKPIEG